ncbi:STARD3 N-terminal-like protein isoform X2 [Syngnathoides biaculeatus]|uniref:STARD3 N-terminal-like protein isoform X2 n=1 Tax=Syngnathoides biaculeatus TaxID=300417 RepID=UPI002ADD7849|nr:STARD3 N-terminal-like protein isoform X2 [Syngnathoides biaculeatus]
MDSRCSSSAGSRQMGSHGARSSTPLQARTDSYEEKKKCISDVRRTFCLFVTFDLLFVTLLWIIELNVNGGLPKQLNQEVVHYNYHGSFFDIFLLAVFRFAVLILAYAVCRLRHWWAVAILNGYQREVEHSFGNCSSLPVCCLDVMSLRLITVHLMNGFTVRCDLTLSLLDSPALVQPTTSALHHGTDSLVT